MSTQTKVKVSNQQVFMCGIAALTAFGHFVYVHLAILYAGRDSWIALMIGVAIGLPMVYIQTWLAKNHAHRSLVENTIDVWGKWLGSIIGSIYVIYFLCVVAITLKILTNFMGVVFPTTPPSLFLLFEFVIAAWVSYSGLEVLSRTVQILLPVLMLLGVSASLLSLPDKDFTQIYPVLARGLYPIFQGGLVFAAMFSELIVFMTVVPHVAHPDKLPRHSMWTVGILFIMFLAPVTGPIMVFGESLAKSLAFPTFMEIQYIHVGNIVERFDLIGVLLWTIGSFFRISIFLFAAIRGMADLFDAKRENAYAIPAILLASGLSLSIMQASREEVYHFLGTTYLFIAPSIGVGLPVLTFGLSKIKKKLKPSGSKRKLQGAGSS